MLKDYLDSERGNPLPPLIGILFPLSSKGSLNSPTHREDSSQVRVFNMHIQSKLL